jgi:beta-galactosidase
MKFTYSYILLFIYTLCFGQENSPREKILIDDAWHFAFGHPSDVAKDYNHATGYFSYLAKTGYGDGPAAPDFDDRAWRQLNLPHDWAVEQPFSEEASFSHGFKASGKGYPEKSIGWYRKTITIPKSDLGRRITLQFDGVFRNSKVWLNGHYLGTEQSGYDAFEYDITEYINYDGNNVIAVRVDAGMEEGWFYEGAGIYRHVYLCKTNKLHIATNGTYVVSAVNGDNAEVTATVFIENHKIDTSGEVEVVNTIYDSAGKRIAAEISKYVVPGYYKTTAYKMSLKVFKPKLWDIDNPELYRLVTVLKCKGNIIDEYQTTFGIRTIHFDAEKGFFLNEKPLKLKGTNNHQDHAGVGTALPDELQYYRIRKLKEMGSNAYRCSHHPPTPELLKACDELGMLVIDETRLMGVNEYHLGSLKKMIERDRNHPSVISWSVGNEEWAIENSITGERIAQTMEAFTKSLDSTRPVTVGISGGFKSGISSVVEVMGYNYLGNGDIEAHRGQYKQQPGMGTEEGSTFATRGVYFTDDEKHYQSAYDKKPRPSFYSIEEGWNFYAARPYLAGMFIWTGFDYRGEPTPYGWPSVTSYFGMMDVCGFAKDNVYYLKSWWGKEDVLHILPHWNWEEMEGREIDVWVYSNCDEVELFLNGKSLGKKKMQVNSHLEWNVPYSPGKLSAVGYKNGKRVLQAERVTTGSADKIKLTPHKNKLSGSTDVAVITVEVTDNKGRHVPTASNEIQFTIKGPGKIIGVGNGNPTSLEPDKFLDSIALYPINDLREQPLATAKLPSVLPNFNLKDWREAFKGRDYKNLPPAYAYQGIFTINGNLEDAEITYYYKNLGTDKAVFINGIRVMPDDKDPLKFKLSAPILKEGNNTVAVIAPPIHKVHEWDIINTDPGVIQVIKKAPQWKRKLFNGYAQLIIQADKNKGKIEITAEGAKLKGTTLVIQSAGGE